MHALVISGGGSKGAFAVGALEVLKEAYTFNVIAGTSTGALIAPLAAIDDYDKLVEIYTSVRNQDILRLNWRKLFKTGVYDFTPLRTLIEETMFSATETSSTRYERLVGQGKLVLLCAASLQQRSVQYFSQTTLENINAVRWRDAQEFVDAIIASSSQPLFTPPVDIHGEQWVDGGVQEIAPINTVIQLGATRVIAIVNAPANPTPSTEHYNNLLTAGARALELMSDEVLRNDVLGVRRYNQLLQYIDNVKYRLRVLYRMRPEQVEDAFGGLDAPLKARTAVDLLVIRPENELPGNSLSFDPGAMEHMRQLGRAAAHRTLEDAQHRARSRGTTLKEGSPPNMTAAHPQALSADDTAEEIKDADILPGSEPLEGPVRPSGNNGASKGDDNARDADDDGDDGAASEDSDDAALLRVLKVLKNLDAKIDERVQHITDRLDRVEDQVRSTDERVRGLETTTNTISKQLTLVRESVVDHTQRLSQREALCAAHNRALQDALDKKEGG